MIVAHEFAYGGSEILPGTSLYLQPLATQPPVGGKYF